MKVTFDIDCTPEEARIFFGLPDVVPMQEVLMEKIQERMLQGLDAMSPEALMKSWMPGGVQGMEQMQKMFWNAMMSSRPKSQ